MARKKKHAEHVNHERWLVSYADFITLLFAFFTTLYSISSVDQKKAGKLMYSMLTALNVEFFPSQSGVSGYSAMGNPAVTPLDGGGREPVKRDGTKGGGQAGDKRTALTSVGRVALRKLEALPGADPKTIKKMLEGMGIAVGGGPASRGAKGKPEGDGEGKGPGRGGDGPIEKMAGVAADLESLQKDPKLKGRYQVRIDSRGILISLSEAGFFHSGSAELRSGAFAALDAIAAVVAKQGCPEILVEGHTDNVPIRSRRYGSNWDLSTSRATFVVAYFMSRKQFDPTHLSAVGRGEFQPIDTNQTSAGRARNRRVDIVVRFPADEGAPLPSTTAVSTAVRKADTFATAARAGMSEHPIDERPPKEAPHER